MPKPLSMMKSQWIPDGLYRFEVIKEEETKDKDQRDSLKLYLKVWDQGNHEYNKIIFLNHDEYGFYKVYRYCLATGRDYMKGQLKDLVGDKAYIHFVTGIWKKKEDNGQISDIKVNRVKDFLSATDASFFHHAANENLSKTTESNLSTVAEIVDDEIPF